RDLEGAQLPVAHSRGGRARRRPDAGGRSARRDRQGAGRYPRLGSATRSAVAVPARRGRQPDESPRGVGRQRPRRALARCVARAGRDRSARLRREQRSHRPLATHTRARTRRRPARPARCRAGARAEADRDRDQAGNQRAGHQQPTEATPPHSAEGAARRGDARGDMSDMTEPRSDRESDRLVGALADLFDRLSPITLAEAEEELRGAGTDPHRIGVRIEHLAQALPDERAGAASDRRPSVDTSGRWPRSYGRLAWVATAALAAAAVVWAFLRPTTYTPPHPDSSTQSHTERGEMLARRLPPAAGVGRASGAGGPPPPPSPPPPPGRAARRGGGHRPRGNPPGRRTPAQTAA